MSLKTGMVLLEIRNDPPKTASLKSVATGTKRTIKRAEIKTEMPVKSIVTHRDVTRTLKIRRDALRKRIDRRRVVDEARMPLKKNRLQNLIQKSLMKRTITKVRYVL